MAQERGNDAAPGNRLSAAEIAELIGGEVEGDPLAAVTGAAGIAAAGEGEITLAGSERFRAELEATGASVVVVPKGMAVPEGLTVIRCDDPDRAFCAVLEKLLPRHAYPTGVAEGAHVDPGATLGTDVTVRTGAVVEEGAAVGDRTIVSSGCFIGHGATIGANCLLGPGVVLLEGVTVGDRCIIGANTVIGSDGFGFIPGKESHRKVPQVGTVVIEDDVELGACCTVDRARLDVTVIGRGTKIDDVVHVAHNVKVGRLCLIAAQVGFAGSTSVGDGSMFAGQVGVIEHVKVGAYVKASGQAGITKTVPDGTRVTGFPAMEHRKWLASQVAVRKLPKLADEVRRLKARLDELEGRTEDPRA